MPRIPLTFPAGADATLRVWTANSGRLVKIVRGHKSAGAALRLN